MSILSRRSAEDGFPKGFRIQPIQSAAANALVDLAPADIARHFRDHPAIAQALLDESYDKRFTPSTFITEEGDTFKVGWFTTEAGYECVKTFANLADAATDYLLFSLGKGRWGTESEDPR